MEKHHENCIRGFHHLSKAWYGSSNLICGDEVDEITIGLYDPNGGTSSEFTVVWTNLCKHVAPQLRVFDDAWSALALFQDVLERMAEVDGQSISPDSFAAMLEGLGITNLTKTKQE